MSGGRPEPVQAALGLDAPRAEDPDGGPALDPVRAAACWWEGRTASYKGQGQVVCPFGHGTPMRRAGLDGHRAGQRLAGREGGRCG